jgi:hypothetical protein
MMIHDRSAESASEEGAAENGSAEDFAAFARLLGRDWTAMRSSLRRLALVELRRMHLRAVELFFVALFYACAFMSVLAVTVVGSIYVITGLRAVFARWIGGGVPELLAGLCGLGLSLGIAYALRAWLRYRVIRMTARRLAVLGATSAAAPSPTSAPAAGEAG